MTNKFLKKLFPVDEEDKIEFQDSSLENSNDYLVNIFEKDFEVEKKAEIKQNEFKSNSFSPVVLTPKEYNEVESIAKEIIAKKTIIISLDNFINDSSKKHLATRFIDFLAGVCFTQNVEIKRINSTTFMFTPRG